jgi:hypothetical protein
MPATEELMMWPWRIGGTVGRTVYATAPDTEPAEHARDEGGILIGMFDTPELAAEACWAHNVMRGHL